MLVVDDEVDLADAVAKGLRREGYAVDLAYDGEDALEKIRLNAYDLVCLDITMPGTDGREVCRQVRADSSLPGQPRILMLTARDGLDDRVAGLDDGADDYLVKPFSFLELVARLQALQRRGRSQEPMQLRIADLQIDLIARKAWRAGSRIELTAKEFALLAVLARRQGEILSKTAIAELVWDMNFDSNTNVVEVAIKRLRAKIDAAFSPKLLHTIRGMGYVMELRSDDAGAS